MIEHAECSNSDKVTKSPFSQIVLDIIDILLSGKDQLSEKSLSSIRTNETVKQKINQLASILSKEISPRVSQKDSEPRNSNNKNIDEKPRPTVGRPTIGLINFSTTNLNIDDVDQYLIPDEN